MRESRTWRDILRVSRWIPGLAIFGWVLAGAASAEITLFGESQFQASASASSFPCNDGDGGASITMAEASCADGQGTLTSAASTSSIAVDTLGAQVQLTTTAEAATIATGGNKTGLGTSFASGGQNYSMSTDTFYVIESLVSSNAQGASSSADVTLLFAGSSAASGQVPMGIHFLNVNTSSSAGVDENAGVLSGQASTSVSVEITFAEVTSSTLIRGTILAGGAARPGLIVEALAGTTVIDATSTASDGAYLLTSVDRPVIVRARDPQGAFQTVLSPVLTPPAIFDADLTAAAAVPTMGLRWTALLALALVGLGMRAWASDGGRLGA